MHIIGLQRIGTRWYTISTIQELGL